MSNPTWISRRAWVAVPLLGLVFVLLTTAFRVRRVDYVSHAAGAPDPAAPWQPGLIVPGHHNESYEWLDQTMQMFAHGEWRVRHVDYENAPSGHDVFAASPYRWWLGTLAAARHVWSHSPMGPSVEWAALYSDPLMLLLFGAATTVFTARRYGPLVAALVATTVATLFPFGTEFLPGIPDDQGFTLVCAVWSILPLLAGAAASDPVRARRWFRAGGIAGGIGLWIGVAREVPILLGVGLGALAAAWVARSALKRGLAAPLSTLPWRAWAQAGAATCLLAYLIEYFPAHLGVWELRAIHPIFGVAWLGGGELVMRGAQLLQEERRRWTVRDSAACVVGMAALASLPVSLWMGHNLGFLALDLESMRLSLLPGGASAANLWAWMLQNGFTGTIWATVLPFALVIPAGVIVLLPGKMPAALRIPVALALGPVLVAAVFAIRQISWWNSVDAALISLVVATAAAFAASARPRLVASAAGALAACLLIPGAWQLWPWTDVRIRDGLTQTEIVGLVERDMAYWLAKHVGTNGAVVLAPPNETATLYYYGGVRGLASFGWDNQDGFQTAVRIASATTPEEAQELIGIHGVTHIIIPLWDPFMDAYAQIGEGQVEGTFLARLHQWNLPPWLRPVPYLLPTIGGFEGESAVILEVVDEQDDASAASSLVQYFIDMQQLDLAVKAGVRLRRFPADLGALLARAQLEVATTQNGEYADTVNLLIRRLGGGADKTLPWDQRVNLAILLAQTHHIDLARARLGQCLEDVDDDKLRSLSTNALYRMQLMIKAFGMEIRDAHVRETAADLLPPDLRSRLVK